MKILVLGATGRTGYLFTRKALEEGHTVTAYVRNPDKALTLFGAHQNLTIVPGAWTMPNSSPQHPPGKT